MRSRISAPAMVLAVLTAASALVALPAQAKVRAVEAAQRTAEMQVRNLIGPVIDKYCRDDCKLLSIAAHVDLSISEGLAPGFDEISSSKEDSLAPTGAEVKVLVDDKVGPVSRGKLVDLLQQHLDTLEYPVKLDLQVTHFPPPLTSTAKANEMREKVSKDFRKVIDELFTQFCPEQCMLADYDLKTDVVNGEEAQYGSSGEFMQDGDVAIKIKNVTGTILVDDTLSPEERANLIEMARLKTNYLKNVNLTAKAMKFPRPILSDRTRGGGAGRGLASVGPGGVAGAYDATNTKSSDTSTSNATNSNSSSLTDSRESRESNKSTSNSTNSNALNEQNQRTERLERVEKIERVEQGDAIHEELKVFKVYGLVFACAILSLLIFNALASMRGGAKGGGSVHRVIQNLTSDPALGGTASANAVAAAPTRSDEAGDSRQLMARRYEIERLTEELMRIFSEQPKVAKQVFTRVLTEEGVEVTSQYLDIFGESVVMDMLRDPSLQADLGELMEFYARNPGETPDEEKLELLKRLHNRTVAGKLVVMGNRSSNLFDFLAEMDGPQISELVRTESLTVKAIVLTQVDPQKRTAVYAQLDDATRMQLLGELSRIDYLPRDYIFNVSTALKRKRKENPRLNTEALPGSEVLVSLLERCPADQQRSVVRNLEVQSPDSARAVKAKLVSVDSLRFLRDGQLLEVLLNLKHDELLQFLKGCADEIRGNIFEKAPRELVLELQDELVQVEMPSRETYQNLERRVVNRMKVMSQEGVLNLIEINERMFSEPEASGFTPGNSTVTVLPPGRGTAA